MATPVTVKHDASFKTILLYPGMPVEEIKTVVCAAFGLPSVLVVGLTDPEDDVHFPIALLSRAPGFFSSKPFELSLLPEEGEFDDDEGGASDDEDDDDEDEDDEDEGREDGEEFEGRGRVGDVLFSLTSEQMQQLMECFHRAAPNGDLDRSDFEGVFETVLGSARDTTTKTEMHKVLSQLFNIFDRDKNGLVSTLEFQTGLSVLGKGRLGGESPAVRQAFEAYDLDGNGYVSIDEMVRYLTTVFVVISEQKPQVFEANRVTPAELAEATAKRCFEEADLDEDGRLTFDEFRNWYTSPSSDSFRQFDKIAVDTKLSRGTALPPLAVVRAATGLGNMSPVTVFEHFKKHAGAAVITRTEFIRCLKLLMPQALFKNASEYADHARLMDEVFSLFDANGDGVVDFTELTSGLSVLCGGHRDDKVQAAFDLFDTSGDGFISKDEMVTYLTSVFRVLYETSAETKEASTVSPEVLALATTEQCFIDADANGDGFLSFEEFKYWFSKSGQDGGDGEDPQETVVPALPDDVEATENKLDEVKKLTNLAAYDVNTLIDFFKGRSSPSGHISKQIFFDCFAQLVELNLEGQPPLQVDGDLFKQRLQALFEFLFSLFDTDSNGVIDMAELVAGLSVLSGGTQDSKVHAAFTMFDKNGDGFISLEEMTSYLHAVFKMLFESSPSTREAMGVSPLTLADVTAMQCFRDAGKGDSGLLSFDEFQLWYSKSGPSNGSPTGFAGAPNVPPSDFVPPLSLSGMSELTGLGNHHVDDVFQLLAHCADDEGLISRLAFGSCFRVLLGEDAASDRLAQAAVEQLFDILADSGVASFDGTASGLSVLCGGTQDEKVQAAFNLFDLANSGFIAPVEVLTYMTAVFSVLFETSPDVKARLGVSAVELAQVTTAEAFEQSGGHVSADGLLSFEGFGAWCRHNQLDMSGSGAEGREKESAAEAVVSLREISAVTGLASMGVDDVFEVFAQIADDNGTVGCSDFTEVLEGIMNASGSELSAGASERLLDELYEVFDSTGVGVVDFAELMSGLSVLCGGHRDDKARAAFNLFDTSGHGFISKDEIVTYLTSVFKLIFATKPELYDKVGVGPEEFGAITGDQAFADADIDHEGRISFQEFQRWYTLGGGAALSLHELPVSEVANKEPGSKSTDMRRARWLLNLDKHSLNDLLDTLVEAAPEGLLSRQHFRSAMLLLVRLGGNFDSKKEEYTKALKLIDLVYDEFDSANCGQVDVSHLTGGLSTLCDVGMDDKINFAFALYDIRGEGFVSFGELVEYTASVFKVLFVASPHLKGALSEEMSADELAHATAAQAFEEAGLHAHSNLNKEAFKAFVNRGLCI